MNLKDFNGEIIMAEENKEIELTEKRAMVYLPENSVEISVACKVYENGELVEVQKVLKLSEIQASFMDAEENYIGPDDKFQITEEGLKWLDEHKKSFGFDFE